jgi:hypothetical protein
MSNYNSFRINSPKVTHETIDGEVVIVNLDSGNYYSLNGVGAVVWRLIAEVGSLDKIVAVVADRYEGDRSEMETAVNRLIAELQTENLILLCDANCESAATATQLEKSAEKNAFEAPVLHKYTDMQDLLLLDPIHEVDEMGWPKRADLPVEDNRHEN